MEKVTHQNPYETLPSDRFWKTGVAMPIEQSGLGKPVLFKQLWHPKFTLNKNTQFATAGSCFAQHISHWLVHHDYRWIDAEPADEAMSHDARKAGHYGVFSFRTGNIYTAVLLKQWIFWALGITEMPDEMFEHDGVYYDPFRPSIPVQGYASKEALLIAREKTLSSIRTGLAGTDVFIFTLGLTEAWYHQQRGYVYPHCPGTLKGVFDPEQHGFVNYDYVCIKKDLRDALDAIKTINPHCRFILTVSPVPLTATASDEHVLTATLYSKSVLRAVAGDLAYQCEDVDYFPSYELISAYPIKARFYEKNLRSVTAEGVDFVMQHFGRALVDYRADDLTESLAVADLLCEELMLQRYSTQQAHATQQATKQIQQAPDFSHDLLLFGDSHIGRLASAFDFLGVGYVGDHIMDGSQWIYNKFALDQDEYFVPLQNKLSRQKWQSSLRFFDTRSDSTRNIITNIGIQTDAVIQVWMKRNPNIQDMSDTVLMERMTSYFISENADKITLLKRFVADGYRVIVMSDPPVQHHFARTKVLLRYFECYEKTAHRILSEMGIDFFCARDYFKLVGVSDVGLPDDYVSENPDDWIHGSQDYYDEIALDLAFKFGIKLAFRLDDVSEEMAEMVQRVKSYM